MECKHKRDNHRALAAAANPCVRRTASETQNLLSKSYFPRHSESSPQSFSDRASQSHDRTRSAKAFAQGVRNLHPRPIFSRKPLPATLCTRLCTTGFGIPPPANPECRFRCGTNTPESPFQSRGFANALASPDQLSAACKAILPCPPAENCPSLLHAPQSKARVLRKNPRSNLSQAPSACRKHSR